MRFDRSNWNIQKIILRMPICFKGTQEMLLGVFLVLMLVSSSWGSYVIKATDDRFEEGRRIIPWCVNGADEPDFKIFPLSEFKPFLDKNKQFKEPKLSQFRYEIELRKIKIVDQEIGDSGTLYFTTHFVFSSFRRTNFSAGVNSGFRKNEIEGLIVQLNYAPYGVGLPTGTFLDPESSPCSDCTTINGRPVACKRKPWTNFMHPTVLVYHHLMPLSAKELEKKGIAWKNKYMKRLCHNDKGELPEKSGDMNDCDENRPCDEAKEYKVCKIPQTYYRCSDNDDKKCVKDKECVDPSVVTGELVPTCAAHDPELKDTGETPPEFPRILGRTTEVHGNLVWYPHPCHLTRVVHFTILVVNSFEKGQYYTIPASDPNGLFTILLPPVPRNDKYHPPFVPSPLFTGFKHTCEDKTKIDFKPQRKIEFDYSRAYDICIRNISGVFPILCDKDVPAFISKVFHPPALCEGNLTKDYDKLFKSEDTSKWRNCSSSCPGLMTTTTVKTTTTKEPWPKRTFHGAINFITNFCIMPITWFIARFYKETYNLKTYKGGKLWYWMHLFGSGGSSVLMYFGYFSKEYVNDTSLHVVIGNIYIMVLAFAYITAWGRHTNHKITSIAESIHGVSGYCCLGLAIGCMVTVEGLDMQVQIFVYTSSCLLAVFYIGMEAHICSMDSRFGMKPRRRHFPSIEPKFDDLPVPGARTRKVLLIVLAVIVFCLTFATIFVPLPDQG